MVGLGLALGASALASDSVVVFNEVHYHPTGDETAEWIELHNQMSYDIDISNWAVDGGILYRFPEGTLVPGKGYLVLAADPDALNGTIGDCPLAGPFEGRLANSGEALRLMNNDARIMDEMAYEDGGDWPAAPDGSGATLAKIDPDATSAPAEHWTWSAEAGGTPGRRNFPPPPDRGGFVRLLESGAPARAYVPRDDSLGSSWIEPDFDDSSWLKGTTGVGYETRPDYDIDYQGLFGLDVEESIYSVNLSCYARIPFQVQNPASLSSLTLRMQYDAGFVAYLNGVEVARANVGSSLAWNSGARRPHFGAKAVAFESFDISSFSDRLLEGKNLLAIHGLNDDKESPDFLQMPEILAHWDRTAGRLLFSEISAADAEAFRVELRNAGEAPLELSDFALGCSGSTETETALGPGALAPGAFLTLDAANLGFYPAEGDRLFLHRAEGRSVVDAAEVTGAHRARETGRSDEWYVPTAPSWGAENTFEFQDAIVINEILYHHRPVYADANLTSPTLFAENPEEWIELYNRSGETVDLGGWRLDGAIGFEFASGTTLAAGAFLVVARDGDALRATRPGIAIVGDYDGSLSDSEDCIRLLDAVGNPADLVRYFDGGRWPSYADGGGASLELRDPDADNAQPEAWAASDESPRSEWRSYSYESRTRAEDLGPDNFNDFVLGLLDEGEVLLDDISVVRDPDGSAEEVIQNGSFEGGDASAWRLIGNHRHSRVQIDPDDPGNRVLRLKATGPAEHMSNHAETTLKSASGYVKIAADQSYRIAFRAKWLAGSPLLNSRLYFNRVPRTTILSQPALCGTPGVRNSRYEPNIGPTFEDLEHYPVVPEAGKPVEVFVRASDADGVASCTLRWEPMQEGWREAPMALGADGRFSATIQGYKAETVVRFYVEARDALGTTSTFPCVETPFRALYRVQDGRARPALTHNFRIITTDADTQWMHTNANLMSNDYIGATIVYNEREVFYHAGVRMKGSPYGRPVDTLVSWIVRFSPDKRFRGVHDSVAVDRSARGPLGTPQVDELAIKLAINHSSGIASVYDDLVHVSAPIVGQSSIAQLNMARYGSVFIDSQFENDGDGVAFEFDGAYYFSRTGSGSVEDQKYVEPGPISYTDIRDLGDDKEYYRLNWLPKNKRDADDYSGIMELNKAFDLEGEELDAAVDAIIDVNEWMRYYALISLVGIGDTYTFGNPHNLRLYQRPSDGRFIVLPHDMDVSFSRATNDTLWGADSWNLVKITSRWQNRRLFYGHLRDLIVKTYNPEYMKHWTDLLARYSGADYTVVLNYIRNRGSYVLSQLPEYVPFAVTDSGANPTSATTVRIRGTAWIDLGSIRLEGNPEPLALTWTREWSGTSDLYLWETTIPLAPGENALTLWAYDLRGEALSSSSLTIVSTQPQVPLHRDLRVTELMYNAAGGRAYDFIELRNTGSETLDLSGVALSGGVTFSFPDADSGGFLLGAGDYVVLVEDRDAFAERYGSGAIRVAGAYSGALSNDGERLALVDGQGFEFLAFTYDDGPDWPAGADGGGYSLVPVDSAIATEPLGSLNLAQNWRAGGTLYGTPGRAEPEAPSSVNWIVY